MLCLVLPLTGGCPKAFLSDCVCTCGPKPLCLILLLTHGQASSAECLISSLRDGCSKDLSVQLYVHNKACLGLPLTNRCCMACLPRCPFCSNDIMSSPTPHKRGSCAEGLLRTLSVLQLLKRRSKTAAGLSCYTCLTILVMLIPLIQKNLVHETCLWVCYRSRLCSFWAQNLQLG